MESTTDGSYSGGAFYNGEDESAVQDIKFKIVDSEVLNVCTSEYSVCGPHSECFFGASSTVFLAQSECY